MTAYPSLVWEEVEEGAVLPGFDYELSLLRLVAFVRATGLYDYVHHDSHYAQAVGAKDAFISTTQVGGLFTRLITDWSGPATLLRRIVFSMTAQCLRGDMLAVSGKVSRKHRGADGSYLVDIALNIALPEVASAAAATATVEMPSSSGRMPAPARERSAEEMIAPNEDMPDFARAMIGQMREGNWEPRAPLLASDVHLWCEALEDWNPLYWDEAYAAQSPFGTIVSPPVGLFYGADSALNVGLGCRKPGADVPEPVLRNLHGMALMSALRPGIIKGGVPFPPPDCPEAVVTQAVYNFYTPLRVGDTLRTEQRLVTCSPRRKTRLGEGYFVTGENTLLNQRGELVRTASLSLFCYSAA
ncbi:MaoC family dehydratase [Novosphingobium rosa]|uniref:MaoC family dehydratase n=1 Tax=Novosphingobium rosa TaxID=76978 RepID=UPI000830A0DF|nr:MaoC family dehydratase N-terminal domain-containing protein [Novosphingobium rosa]